MHTLPFQFIGLIYQQPTTYELIFSKVKGHSDINYCRSSGTIYNSCLSDTVHLRNTTNYMYTFDVLATFIMGPLDGQRAKIHDVAINYTVCDNIPALLSMFMGTFACLVALL